MQKLHLLIWAWASACPQAAKAVTPVPAVPPPTEFVALANNSETVVTIARSKNGPPWIRAVQELPVAAERVFSVLSDFERYAVLFAPHVKTAKILTRDGQSARLHLVWPLPFPMRNRDAVVRYTSAKEDTLYKVRWQHAPESSDPSEGLRIEVVAGETVLTARTPETTSVEYTYFADLGGDLPDFIKEASYKEEPVAYFNALRKHFSLPLSPSL